MTSNEGYISRSKQIEHDILFCARYSIRIVYGKLPASKKMGLIAIFIIAIVIVSIWFKNNLLFATGEESLSFYNPTRSLNLFSQLWYEQGTGFEFLIMLPRTPYFAISSFFYELGVSAVLLQAATFLILIATGMVSVYFLVYEFITKHSTLKKKELIPFLAAIFYFLNPLSMTQVWGRAVSFQFFAFALIPFFLLMFVLAINRRKIYFCIFGILASYLFSVSYSNPAITVSSWIPVILYFFYYLYTNRKEKATTVRTIITLFIYIIGWIFVQFFWIYPFIVRGKEFLSFNLGLGDNVLSLKGVSATSGLLTVLQLFHWEFVGDQYGSFYHSFIIRTLFFLIPLALLISLPKFKKLPGFYFCVLFFLFSLFLCIGDNPPTGFVLVWVFKTFPVLQVLRNPYEKNGINLMLAYAPFVAIGFVSLSEYFARLTRRPKLTSFYVAFISLVSFGVLIWPMWRGSFSGGYSFNTWISVPIYYNQANDWFNAQDGDFRLLHVPLLPEDGVNYTWEHPYQGIEPSEFLFDRQSVSKYNYFFRNYYAVLQDRFGINRDVSFQKVYGRDSGDFEEESLVKELAKLNVRYIVLHRDLDSEFRGAVNPDSTRDYLNAQSGVKKVITFGALDIYELEIPSKNKLIYSPDADTTYKKVSPSNYEVRIKSNKENAQLFLLNTYNDGWKAFDGETELNHTRSFSYANSWRLKKEGESTINIFFEPQKVSELGKTVSLVSIGFLVFALAYLLFPRKYL